MQLFGPLRCTAPGSQNYGPGRFVPGELTGRWVRDALVGAIAETVHTDLRYLPAPTPYRHQAGEANEVGG